MAQKETREKLEARLNKLSTDKITNEKLIKKVERKLRKLES